MSKILLDQSAPKPLCRFLTGHEVRTAYQMGWNALGNGKLMDAAEAAGFKILVTADQNLRFQQNMAGRKLAVVALGTNHWNTIRPDPSGIIAACAAAVDGDYIVVPFPKRPRQGKGGT